MNKEGRGGGKVPVDFICCVAADHVKDGFVAAGMELHPRIDSQHAVVKDDDCFAIGDLRLNIASAQDGVGELSHCGGVGGWGSWVGGLEKGGEPGALYAQAVVTEWAVVQKSMIWGVDELI